MANRKTIGVPASDPVNEDHIVQTEQPKYSELIYKSEEREMTIKVRLTLTFEERAKMTEYIANFPFIENEYVPYLRNMGRYTYVFAFYTDLDVDSMSTEEVYRLSQDRELLKAIYELANDDIGEIFTDAEHLIDWRKQKLLHRSADQLYAGVAALIQHLDDTLSKVENDFNPDKGGISVQQLVDAMNGVTAKDEKALAHNVLDFQEARRKAVSQKPKRKRASGASAKNTPKA